MLTRADQRLAYRKHFNALMTRAVTEFNLDREAAGALVHDLLLSSLRQRTDNLPAWLNGALNAAVAHRRTRAR